MNHMFKEALIWTLMIFGCIVVAILLVPLVLPFAVIGAIFGYGGSRP